MSVTPMRFLSGSTLSTWNAPVMPTCTARRQLPRCEDGGNVEACARPSDARLELDEGAELRQPRHAPGTHLSDLVAAGHLRPRILGELLQAERDSSAWPDPPAAPSR